MTPKSLAVELFSVDDDTGEELSQKAITERLERFQKATEAKERRRLLAIMQELLKLAEEDLALSQFRRDIALENQVVGIKKCIEIVKQRPKS